MEKMAKEIQRTVYRDTRTNEFVSEKTYIRSRAQGSRDIVRESVTEVVAEIDDLYNGFQDYDEDDFIEREYSGGIAYE